MRWAGWLGLLLVWTVVLLRPEPVHVKDSMLSPYAGLHAAKLLHVAAYAVLTALAAGLPMSRGRWPLLVVLSLHGWGTEFLQQFVDERTPSLLDVGFDHFGILLGLMVTWRSWFGTVPAASERVGSNPSPQPPPRKGEGEKEGSAPPLRFGEGVGGRGYPRLGSDS